MEVIFDGDNILYKEKEAFAPHSDSLEWTEWKTAVERDLRNVMKRLSALEQKKDVRDQFEGEKSYARVSLMEAATDGLFGSLRSFSHTLTSTKASLLQFFWLVIILATIFLFGSWKFLQAMDNMNAKFKPEKKVKTIDYGDSESEEQYQMPHVYFSLDLDWSCDLTNETVISLLESLMNFSSSKVFYNHNWNASSDYFIIELYEEERLQIAATIDYVLFYEHVDFCCYNVKFRLKFEDPDPSRGRFKHVIIINTTAAAQVDFHDPVSVSFSREPKGDSSSDRIGIYFQSGGYATVRYKEKVTQKWRSADISYFTASLQSYVKIDMENSEEDHSGEESWDSHDSHDHEESDSHDHEEIGMVRLEEEILEHDGEYLMLILEPDLVTEYWEEYVAYDYYDWISAMGGLMGIVSTFFFLGAYGLAITFGNDKTMGLLPKMSRTFRNSVEIGKLNDRICSKE
jgi:hypothetical protein